MFAYHIVTPSPEAFSRQPTAISQYTLNAPDVADGGSDFFPALLAEN
jgi:hypothetical protein